MHFSSPSGHRLSWWWPWNRGAVGRRSSGYWTVSTFRNISWKVTPNPLMGLRKSSTGDLLGAVRVGAGHRGAGDGARGNADPDAVVVGQVQRRDPVAGRAGPAGRATARLGLVGHRIRGRAPARPPLGGEGPGPRGDDDDSK